METIGYEGGVVLPVEARLQQPSEPLALRATVDYLTCADICVPYIAELALDLPAERRGLRHSPTISPAPALRFRAAIGAWIGHRAGAAGRRPVRGGNGDRPPLGRAAGRPDIFVEAPAPLAFSAPQISLSGWPSSEVALAVFNGDGLGRTFDGLPITLTVIDGERTLNMRRGYAPRRTVKRSPPAPSFRTPQHRSWRCWERRCSAA